MARTASTRSRSGKSRKRDVALDIVEAALGLAEERGWPAVRMHDIAEELGVPPGRVLEHYRDLDSVANGWFRRGLEAMIAPKQPDFGAQPAKRRIETCLLAWFDALAPHRRVTVEMLKGKMHIPHPHHWAPGIFDLSRTIHWLREAAMLPAGYGTRRAQMEEIGLTSLFLATLLVWARRRHARPNSHPPVPPPPTGPGRPGHDVAVGTGPSAGTGRRLIDVGR